MTFVEMRNRLLEHFNEMQEGELFEVRFDKDKLWELYLESFPSNKNKIFRERREHDCSCCRHFVKQMGGVVTIRDNKIVSLWDFDAFDDDTYGPSLKAMSDYIHSCKIENSFYSKERRIGTLSNKELSDDIVITWDHFYADIPSEYVVSGYSKETEQAKIRDTKNVFKRSLDEFSLESVDIVLELISQGSLYRGEEHKAILEKFRQYLVEYSNLPENEKDLYTWENAKAAGMSVGRIRNHAIGTLLIDISNDVDLDTAVRKYEAIVAPTNYKRPKAIFTKRMLEDAKKTISDLGYMDSLKRRYATLDDITVNNILFSNRDASKRITGTDVFDDLASEVSVNPKKFDKVEEINIQTFIDSVLPTAKEIEVLFENRLASNMMSLIAPKDKDSKTMFKWSNNFCWAYTGNITDSMKERVKSAGGSITGDLRFSIQWNESGRDNVDLDAHCFTAQHNEIYYADKRDYSTEGELDVDIQRPNTDTRLKGDHTAVENITFPNRRRMADGTYTFFVHQYWGTLKGGFRAEIEFDGNTYSFDYPDMLRQGNRVDVATVTLKNGEFTIHSMLPETNRVNSKEIWNLNTNQFIPVSVVMYSPNYWDEQSGIGNKHYFFMLKDCVNPETPNGFYNEFLNSELDKHKRVMEALGSKLVVAKADDQLSGIGFSSTQRNHIIVKVKGNTERTLKVTF